ncbi:MAG: iron complex transport system ATP-binding protein [Candidatus Ordinivivax streblomastigis]|uniref:Iron complex transport system ATP-binding protein n=1 Tax=Candidatus Ordinivivax streblomastigis TaxID=2540710 RepID=A0A5M8P022_9BACT|nr:MAG: iron complex transport system ATP-binding protein [Candidatus Ordinivivax streblomastigis]
MQLKIHNATLGYPQKDVLRNVNLELHTNKTTCILGKNGAGKTTLFKSILGILPLLKGNVSLDGKNISDWSRRQFARAVAYVPQARSLPFPFTVFEVVLFGRTAHLSVFSSPRKKDRMIAEECLEKLQIIALKNRIFTQLSGGEQQMVIVARALAQQPSFLIMDEPTSSLDFGNQLKIINQVNKLKDDSLGILMATHSPDHAFMCEADVAIVHNGIIWKQGNSKEVITEEVLKDIYDVNVNVCSIGTESDRKICIPTLN